jgi:hypothetical protein
MPNGKPRTVSGKSFPIDRLARMRNAMIKTGLKQSGLTKPGTGTPRRKSPIKMPTAGGFK